MKNEPLLGGVTDRLLTLPKAMFRDLQSVELVEQDLRSLENEYYRYDGFMTFVKILTEENNFIAAERIIRSCADFSELDRAEFLGKLEFQISLAGQKSVGVKMLDEASALALQQVDQTGWSRADCLNEIAKHFIALHELEVAQALLAKAASICQEGLRRSLEVNDPQDAHDSASVLGGIAKTFARLGEVDRANQIADSMPNDMWRNYILGHFKEPYLHR